MDHLLSSDLESGTGLSRLDVEQAEVQSSSSVLVSSKTHNIKLAEPLPCEEKKFASHAEQDE